MPISLCDICSKQVPRGDGYILTTQQVVYSPAYWEHIFRILEQNWPSKSVEEIEQNLPLLALKQAQSQSNWLSCDECIGVFDVDRKQARRYCQEFWATGKVPLIPGAGAADGIQAATAAYQGWEKAFGRKPKESLASIILHVAKKTGSKIHLVDYRGKKKSYRKKQK